MRNAATGSNCSSGSTERIACDHPRRAGAFGADEAAGVGGGREVGVDDGDLIGVAHGAQDRQQLGAEQRIDALQHCAVSRAGVGAAGSTRPSSFNAAQSSGAMLASIMAAFAATSCGV